MRFLLIPENNSLSHIAKSLAIKRALDARGHNTKIAVSAHRSLFLNEIGQDHFILPELRDHHHSALPTVQWFHRPERTIQCIQAEVDLLSKFKPHRVLGVFRLTLKASAQLAGVPFDSLICGCMLPESDEVLGFAAGEPGIELQSVNMHRFFNYAGIKMSQALDYFGLAGIDDIRCMLKGERTYLWDFPEFMPIASKKDLHHVGPVLYNHWPYDASDTPINGRHCQRPLAVISFGTGFWFEAVAERLAECLLNMGFHVLLAKGGQKIRTKMANGRQRITSCRFVPFRTVLPHASLMITHGGQMTIFESIKNGVPLVVMPFQPEQAHNGVCLERIHCGRRLIAPQSFRGDPAIYGQALDRMADHEIESVIGAVWKQDNLASHLARVQRIIRSYNNFEKLIHMIEDPA